MAAENRHIDDILKEGLGEYTERPPYSAWTNMEARLDDQLFAEGLSEYEEVPPVGAWAQLDAQLDAQLFTDALGEYTETPPSHAWPKMEALLDSGRRRRRGFAWYWLAAGLAILLSGTYLYVRDGNKVELSQHADAPLELSPVSDPIVNNERPDKQKSSVAANEQVQPDQQVQNEAAVPGPPAVVKEKQPVNLPAQKQAPEEKPEQPAVAKTSSPSKESVEVQAQQPAKKEIPVASKIDTQHQAQPQQLVAKALGSDQHGAADSVSGLNSGIKTDTVVDDIASAMSRRQPDVLMNIRRSRYADSMAEIAKLEESAEKKVDSNQVAIAEPATEEASTTSAIKEPGTEGVSRELAQSLTGKSLKKLDNAVSVLEPRQDVLLSVSGSQQLPQEQITFEENQRVKDLASKIQQAGVASLAAFIGPMPDTSDYGLTEFIASEEPGDVIARKALGFDIFFKAGYETGFDKYHMSKFLVAPAIQFNFSEKLGLLFQPAFKLAGINRVDYGNATSYHDITASYQDSLKLFSIGHNSAGIIFDSVRANYYYKQEYDSVVVSHKYNEKKIFEIDLPLMASYKLAKNISVYGGPVVTFSRVQQMNTITDRYTAATLRDTVSFPVSLTSAAPKAPGIDEVFSHNAPAYSSYNPKPFENAVANKLRMGAMAGVSFVVKNKLSVDVSLQQNFSRLAYIPSAGVKNIYQQPYLRFMLGYKLYSNKK